MMQKNKKTLMMTGVLLAAGVIAAQAQVGPIYSGDVNYTGTAPGSYTYDEATDTLKVVGCGADIWGTSDSFHFVYIEQDPSEDFDYFVHLSDFTASDGWAKAGLMVRETKGYTYDGSTGEVNGLSMAGGDRYVCVQTQKSSDSSNTQWITQWRPQEGYSVSDSQSKRYGTYTFPQWLRLRRIGNDFHAVVSADGENWEKLYTVKTDAAEYPGDAEAALWELGPLGSNYNSLAIGVFVTSHDEELNDAVLTGNMFQVFPQEPVAFERELEGGEIYAGTDYILSAKVSGYSPYTYVWKKDGVVLTQGTELFNSTFRYKISAATLEDSGSYTLEVSNVANGVTTTKSSTVQYGHAFSGS